MYIKKYKIVCAVCCFVIVLSLRLFVIFKTLFYFELCGIKINKLDLPLCYLFNLKQNHVRETKTRIEK